MPEIAPHHRYEKSIEIMSENQTLMVGIVPAEDGSIKVVISESNSPPLLGAKAVRVRVSQISTLLPARSPFPLARRATRMTS